MKSIIRFSTWLLLILSNVMVTAQLTITEIGTLPEPVSNNAVCEGFIDGVPYLFSFAGIDSTKLFTGIHLKSFRMNLETGESKRIDDLPGDQGLLATAASRIGAIIYIVGGYSVNSNGSEVTSRKVRRYDILNNQFLSDAADLIVPTDDHVQAVWRDSLLFVVTGWSNSSNIRFTQIYDPESDTWTNGTLLPNDNDFISFGASGTIVEDQIFYFGGARSTGNFPIQNYIRVGDIDPDDPSDVSWSIISLENEFYNGYRAAATSVLGAAHWIGGSNNTYNYNGIAYDGSGGVTTANQDVVFAENLLINRTVIDDEIPMDLRGIAKVSEEVQYIAGGMLDNQRVTDKVFRLDIPFTVVPAVKFTAKELGISVFPNPVRDRINLKNEGAELIRRFQILDVKGAQVMAGDYDEKGIDIYQLASANYQIRFETKSGKSATQTIVVVE